MNKRKREMDDQVFQEAVEYVKCLPEDQDEHVSNETKLKLYGLYKQATQVRRLIHIPTHVFSRSIDQ